MTFYPALIDQMECRRKFSTFTLNPQLQKRKNEVLLSQFAANCSTSIDSTQSRLDFLVKGGHGFPSFTSLCNERSGSKILLIMSIFLSVKFMKLFRKSKKSKALTMQLALRSRDKDHLWMDDNF